MTSREVSWSEGRQREEPRFPWPRHALRRVGAARKIAWSDWPGRRPANGWPPGEEVLRGSELAGGTLQRKVVAQHAADVFQRVSSRLQQRDASRLAVSEECDTRDDLEGTIPHCPHILGNGGERVEQPLRFLTQVDAIQLL